MAWFTVAGKTCRVAYAPCGASSLADSYINEANPGTNDAAPGTAPTWASGDGWKFSVVSSHYLTTGIVPEDGQTQSMIVRFSNAHGGARYMCGAANATWGKRLVLIPNYTASTRYYSNMGTKSAAGNWLAGVMAVAGTVGYKDAVSDVTALSAGTGAAITGGVTVGCVNKDGTGPTNYWTGWIQAFAIYSDTLSAAEVSAIGTNMNALPNYTEGSPRMPRLMRLPTHGVRIF